MFPSSIYEARRNRLREQVGKGLVLLLGNSEVGMNYADNVYPFRQDSTFLYFFGIDKPSLAGLIDLENGNDLIFGDDPSVEDIVWTGAQESISELALRCGIGITKRYASLSSHLDLAYSTGIEIHFLPPYRARNHDLISELLPKMDVSQPSIDLIKAVVAQRSIKSKEEIAELNSAVDITNAMHLEAMNCAKAGMTEAEVMARVHAVALSNNVQPAFPIILTVRGEVLHNHHHHNLLKPGQLLLCDSGAESPLHYAGDMSRTFPVNAEFTDIQKSVYKIALDAHETAIDALKPGVLFRDIHLKACTRIAEGMKALGLMKGDMNEAVEAGAHALFFQCGLGHMMGLDVHDMEDLGEEYVGYNDIVKKSTQFGLKSLRLGKRLEQGFVVTIEPGIYFIPELIDLWKSQKMFSDFINYSEVEKFRNFGGLRSEEDFVITDLGSRILGDQNGIPKTIADVEMVRNNALAI